MENAHIDAEENEDGTYWEESAQLDVMPDDGSRDAVGDDKKGKSSKDGNDCLISRLIEFCK